MHHSRYGDQIVFKTFTPLNESVINAWAKVWPFSIWSGNPNNPVSVLSWFCGNIRDLGWQAPKLWPGCHSILRGRRRRLTGSSRCLIWQIGCIERSRHNHSFRLLCLKYSFWPRKLRIFMLLNTECMEERQYILCYNELSIIWNILLSSSICQLCQIENSVTGHLVIRLSINHLLISTFSNELEFSKLCFLRVSLLGEPNLMSILLTADDRTWASLGEGVEWPLALTPFKNNTWPDTRQGEI